MMQDTLAAIPAVEELAHLPRFVRWRSERVNGRPTKIPYRATGKAKASSTDQRTWATLAEAAAGLRPGFGVGVVLGELGDGRRLVGVDLDLAYDPATGTLAPWAARIVRRLNSYTEISPSGFGAKLIGLVEHLPPALEGGGKEKTIEAEAPAGSEDSGHTNPELAIYPGGRFFALTGQHLDDTPDTLEDITEALAQIVGEEWPNGRHDGRQWGDTADTTLPDRLRRFLEEDPEAARAWRGEKIGEGNDTSASGIEFSLARHLARSGFGGKAIAAALGAYPHGQAAKLRGKQAERRIARVVEDVQRDGPEDWPEPDMTILSPHREPAPALPLEHFGGYWSYWTGAAGESKGAAADFVLGPLLALAGAMLANVRRASPWPGWVETPIINTALVDLPSSGKSPARDAVLEIARAIEKASNGDLHERQRDYDTKAMEYKLRLALWEKEAKKAAADGYPPPARPDDLVAPDPPRRRRLVLADVTTEKAARLAHDNPRGLFLARDELAGWLGALDKYGGASDRPFWLEAYDGGHFVADRVKDGDTPIQVDHLAIGITGGVQPDRLASTMLVGDDDGLAARFLYLWPERVPPRRPTRSADPASARAALERLRSLPFDTDEEGKQRWRLVPFSAEAAARMQEWRERVAGWEPEAHGLLLSWMGKLPGMAARLALVLEYLWWCGDRPEEQEPAEVGERAMLAALDLLEGYFLPMTRRAFGDAALPEAERDAIALARWIRANDPETVNARALRHAGAMPTREPERYDAALKELHDAGWVRPAPSKRSGPGRKPKDWEVSPAIGEGS